MKSPHYYYSPLTNLGYIDQAGERNMESDKAGGVLLLLGLITVSSSSFLSMFCPAELKLKPFFFFECVSFGLLL